jgi:hypothetical protein
MISGRAVRVQYAPPQLSVSANQYCSFKHFQDSSDTKYIHSMLASSLHTIFQTILLVPRYPQVYGLFRGAHGDRQQFRATFSFLRSRRPLKHNALVPYLVDRRSCKARKVAQRLPNVSCPCQTVEFRLILRQLALGVADKYVDTLDISNTSTNCTGDPPPRNLVAVVEDVIRGYATHRW